MTNETKTPMERLAELEEEKNAIHAALRIERVELRKRLEAIDEELGPERVEEAAEGEGRGGGAEAAEEAERARERRPGRRAVVREGGAVGGDRDAVSVDRKDDDKKLLERVECLDAAAKGLAAARTVWASLVLEAVYEVEPLEEGAAGRIIDELDEGMDVCRVNLRKARRHE